MLGVPHHTDPSNSALEVLTALHPVSTADICPISTEGLSSFDMSD